DLVPTKRQGSDSKVAQLRLVHLGETDGQRTIVLKGLKEGDEVIVRGWQTLKEGTPVVAVQWGEWGPTEFPAGTLPPLSPPLLVTHKAVVINVATVKPCRVVTLPLPVVSASSAYALHHAIKLSETVNNRMWLKEHQGFVLPKHLVNFSAVSLKVGDAL
ncbi:MAG: hypothetical protein ACUVSC_13015, partial [Candidatus Fervidibacter sp.]